MHSTGLFETKNWIRVPILNGVIAAFLGFFVLLVLYFIGKHPFLFMLFFDFRIILFSIFMVLTLKTIRDYHQNGVIFFWQGMVANFIFTLLFALTTAGLLILWCFIYPNFVTDYIITAVHQLQSISDGAVKQLGQTEYENNLNYISTISKYKLVKHYTGQTFIVSTFISIITAVILRRQTFTS